MFVVKTITLSKKYSNQNHIVLLFDASATVPLSAKYEPEIFLNEIDNFIVFLENNKKLGTNLIRLRLNIDANYMTITQRLRSMFKYFVYLLDEYWSVRYQD